MGVTMHDVAQLAGVSQRTVSNVVNGYRHVRPETRARVQDAISRLRYRPNISAQNLRRGRTGLLALALPEITAPYFAELADQLQRYAEECGVTLLMDQTGGDRDRELLVLEGYRSSLIDGLILSPLALHPQDLGRSGLDIPIVLLGERIDDSTFLHVSIDNVTAAQTATDHLLGGGRRRIAVIGAPEAGGQATPGPALRRYQGYGVALGRAGVALDDRLVVRTLTWTRPFGYEATMKLLDLAEPPDAIFCFNDTLAVGALKALSDRRIRVPEDVAVLGWDDIAEASFTTPTLTTIAPDKAQIVRSALDLLLATIEGRPTDIGADRPGFELVVRQST